MEGTIGEIRMFGGTFAPKNWSYCNGSTIAIASNTALFSILGTTYGGNGTTTFQLPNLQSRVAIGVGQGPGLSNYALGQSGGSENFALTVNTMANHAHMITGTVVLPALNGQPEETSPVNGFPANNQVDNYGGSGTINMANANVRLQTGMSSGAGLPFSTVQPVLGMNYIICMYGVFPSRS